MSVFQFWYLTHWGRVTHICVNKLTLIGSDNGLSPGRRQAIIRTNAGILLIGPLGTNFSEILSEIHTFSFKKMHLKTSSSKRRPFCLGLNVLIRFMFLWNAIITDILGCIPRICSHIYLHWIFDLQVRMLGSAEMVRLLYSSWLTKIWF